MPEKSPKSKHAAKSPDLDRNKALRALPGVDRVLELLSASGNVFPKTVALKAARRAAEQVRGEIASGAAAPLSKDAAERAVLNRSLVLAQKDMQHNLRRVINGTGVVVHTNLGRSLLPDCACRNITAVAGRCSNLEFDLEAGRRGSRFSAVEELLCELTGAEAAMVVNNNAGAVFLCLMALAKGREVIVSRGELVEIGGAFRIPDVMAASGAVLREVGTTNRTHLRDYEQAVNEQTAMVLKAHTSNFAVVGFTASVPLKELAALGKERGLLVMEDLGSGSLVDLSRYGLAREPTVGDSAASGADVVTFSGDKMLGGPQAGVIIGRKEALDRVKKHPVARALRIDKLTLAGLEAVLRLYRDPLSCVREIPTLAMLTENPQAIKTKARKLCNAVNRMQVPGLKAKVISIVSRVGGGALPLQELPSFGVALEIAGQSANILETAMRSQDLPVIGRIEEGAFLLDLRTIAADEIVLAAQAAKSAAETHIAKARDNAEA